MGSFEAERNRQTVGLFQSLVQLLPHLRDSLIVLGLANQIACFVWIVDGVVEFVGVPDSVILN